MSLTTTAWPYPLPADHPDFHRDILARTLWGESRSEGRKGMEAVASVILNRVAKPSWWSRTKADGIPDNTVAAVCLKPWQFSAWNPGDPNRAKMLAVTADDLEFSMALEVAAQAIAGVIPDQTGGACHYKVDSWPWPAAWGPEREPDYRCGRHDFYRGIA